LKLDFLREIVWPGTVDIGTGLSKIGNSSVVILQELYQNDLLVARAETVVVQVSAQTGKGEAFSDEARTFLQSFLLPIVG
jgi:acyl-CoA thioester hydrolase